ncbi:unnamed protein product [Prorocentrum cordatum]|uniref:Uncharacterized protein n=1 Tax=Prorocentrum cordatum TaxID=2364126 RepID=A0ABN9UUX0_9DINO|nr:unnamed protein product [Polarella glacialis]
MSRVHGEFPRAMVKSAHIDEDAVETACAALANSVLKGNTYQFEALQVVLRSMMPPLAGSQQVRGPPPEAFPEKARMKWSEEDGHGRAPREPAAAAGLRGGVRQARGLRQGGLPRPAGARGRPGSGSRLPQVMGLFSTTTTINWRGRRSSSSSSSSSSFWSSSSSSSCSSSSFPPPTHGGGGGGKQAHHQELRRG